MNRNVCDAVDTNTGQPIYFRSHAKTIYTTGGSNVSRVINKIQAKAQLYEEYTGDQYPNIFDNIEYLTSQKMNEMLGDLRIQ